MKISNHSNCYYGSAVTCIITDSPGHSHEGAGLCDEPRLSSLRAQAGDAGSLPAEHTTRVLTTPPLTAQWCGAQQKASATTGFLSFKKAEQGQPADLPISFPDRHHYRSAAMSLSWLKLQPLWVMCGAPQYLFPPCAERIKLSPHVQTSTFTKMTPIFSVTEHPSCAGW